KTHSQTPCGEAQGEIHRYRAFAYTALAGKDHQRPVYPAQALLKEKVIHFLVLCCLFTLCHDRYSLYIDMIRSDISRIALLTGRSGAYSTTAFPWRCASEIIFS